MFDVVLLEIEGVLAETRTLRRDALVRSLAEDDVVISPDEYDAVCAGFPVRQGALTAVAVRSMPRDDTAVDLIAHRAERYFAEGASKGLTLVPGALQFVQRAADVARLGIVTRAARNEVEMLLSMAALDTTFDVVITADDVTSPKPSPEPYERAIERLNRRRPTRPPRVLALEDGPLGIMAAHAVRMRCIAVGKIPAYHAVEADAYVPSLEGHTVESLADLVLRGEEWRP
jgi:beta-phosphoglucomutase